MASAGETIARRKEQVDQRCSACATGNEADLEDRGNRRDPRAGAKQSRRSQLRFIVRKTSDETSRHSRACNVVVVE